MQYDSEDSDDERSYIGHVIGQTEIGHFETRINNFTGDVSDQEMVGLVYLNHYPGRSIKVYNTAKEELGNIPGRVVKGLRRLLEDGLVYIEGTVKLEQNKQAVHISLFSTPEAATVVMDSIINADLWFIPNEAAPAEQDVANAFDKFSKLIDESSNPGVESLVPPKDIIVSELFPHQKEGLGWLVSKENPERLPPFWEKRGESYVNVLTNYQIDTCIEPQRGGIFADTSGLGKTLTLLSLIALDKRPVLDTEGSRRAAKTRKFEASSESRVTLIVCAKFSLRSWVTQLKEHTRKDSLKVCKFNDYIHDIVDIRNSDVVLIYYNCLAGLEKFRSCPLFDMEWWRLVLDDAHVIDGRLRRAVSKIKAKRRWIVTGAAIHNTQLDFYSFMALLGFKPFSMKSFCSRLVERPLGQRNSKGLERMQALLEAIYLRRTKDKGLIGLPSKSMVIFYVELSKEERVLYDGMESEAKKVVQSYIDNESLTDNYPSVLCMILRLRQLCVDVALCPDPHSLFNPNSRQDVSKDPDLLRKMLSILNDGEVSECSICLSAATDSVITKCAHIFCRACILKSLRNVASQMCPLCRKPLSKKDLFSLPKSSGTGTSKESESSYTPSSKIPALLEHITMQRSENQNIKLVVFSLFQKMLVLLKDPLEAAGFRVISFKQNTEKESSKAIETFDSSSGPTILLANLKSANAKVNLTCASTMYLLEPWGNTLLEEQAIGRVHAIGQKDDVTIVRMIAKNSIEERILELQKKKLDEAKNIFGRRGAGVAWQVEVDDIRVLLLLM